MIQTREVLAAAYRGKRLTLASTRTHAFDTRTGVVLCRGSVQAKHLADEACGDVHAAPTCPRCLRRDPRQQSGGPAILSSILQF